MRTAAQQIETESRLAKQVAHDIRSPLSALNILKHALKGQMSEEVAEVMNGALERLNAIADDLLNIETVQPAISDRNLIAEIRQVIDEKKIVHGQRLKIEFINHVDRFSELNCLVKKSDLQRMTSNILNNAIEAFDGKAGTISVSVSVYPFFFDVEIKDNGKGIPQHVIDKLGTEGFSHEKRGTGLGINHALRVLQEAGGKLTIKSREGVGTVVTLRIPR